MTVREWCKTNGIVELTYYRNLKRFGEEMLGDFPVTVEESSNSAVFRKLEVQTPVSGTQAAVIIRINIMQLLANCRK